MPDGPWNKGRRALALKNVRGVILSCLSLSLCVGLTPAAAGSDGRLPTPVRAPLKIFPKPQRVEVSIPYPNAGMYLYRGIYGSFAGGRYQATDSAGPRNPLFQWQGEIIYFYTPWFSSGMSYKIQAGQPSDSSQEVKNRYTFVARFHKAWPTAAVYSGLTLGVDDVNVSLTPSTDTSNLLTQPLQETNASIGVEVGGGWKFSRYVSATLGERMDVSLVQQNERDRNRALNFRTSPGLALDILKMAPSLQDEVKGLYGLFEVQYGQQLLESGTWRRDFAWITGISIAF